MKGRDARPRARAYCVALFVGVAGAASSARLLAQAGECPLPVNKQLEAIMAFAEMMPVFRHPRCMNCHGGLDPSAPPHPGAGQLDSDLDPIANRDEYMLQCDGCHDGLRGRTPELPGWTIPHPSVFFVGKSDEELCLQMKGFSPTGDHFVEHIFNDHGDIQFIAAGFAGDRALGEQGLIDNSLVAEPPPGTQAELTAKARRWSEIVGDGWRPNPCGCTVKLEGTFSQTDTSEQVGGVGIVSHDYTINGRLVWAPEDEELPSLPSFGDTPSKFMRPNAGEITVEVSAEGLGIVGGSCRVRGTKTLDVARLPSDALQHLWLELAADGRYKLSLGMISRYLLTPVETVCRVMGREAHSSEEWNDVAIQLGVQEGMVSEEGVVGRLPAPIRYGPITIDGNWSFGTGR
jgi:hypothetical protein